MLGDSRGKADEAMLGLAPKQSWGNSYLDVMGSLGWAGLVAPRAEPEAAPMCGTSRWKAGEARLGLVGVVRGFLGARVGRGK